MLERIKLPVVEHVLDQFVTTTEGANVNELNQSQPDEENSQNYSEMVEQIVDSLRQGNKIQAIKFYRESTGAGLKESKEAIEELIQNYDISMKSGCASMLLFTLSTATLIFIAMM